MTLNPFIDNIHMYILVCARAGTQLRGYPAPDPERSSDATLSVLHISERRAGRHRMFHVGQDPLSIGASSTDQGSLRKGIRYDTLTNQCSRPTISHRLCTRSVAMMSGSTSPRQGLSYPEPTSRRFMSFARTDATRGGASQQSQKTNVPRRKTCHFRPSAKLILQIRSVLLAHQATKKGLAHTRKINRIGKLWDFI
jgi:hypothetical protein